MAVRLQIGQKILLVSYKTPRQNPLNLCYNKYLNLGGLRMKVKQFVRNNANRVKKLWRKGQIQKTSRITYDVVWNIVLFLMIVGSMTVIFAGGVGAGYFASLVKDEPIRDYDEMKKDIYNYEETSKLYFADDIYIGDIRADLHREEIGLDEVSEM